MNNLGMPGRSRRGDEALQKLRVGRVSKTSKQRSPSASSRCRISRPAHLRVLSASPYAQTGGDLGQARQDSTRIFGIDPRDQPPPLGQPGPRIRCGKMALAYAAHSGQCAHHDPGARARRVQGYNQVSPQLEPQWPLRDFADNDRCVLTGRQRSIPGLAGRGRGQPAPLQHGNEAEHDRRSRSYYAGHCTNHAPGERVHAVTIRI